MADGSLFHKSKGDAQCQEGTTGEKSDHSPFGGLVGLMGKAKCAVQEKATEIGHAASNLANKAPGAISDAAQNAPKIGEHIDKGSKNVQGALKNAPEPVRNIVGGAIAAPMHSAADLTRLPAEIQKHGVTANVAKRALGDAVGIGAVAVPGVGAPAAGILGHAIKGGVADKVIGQAAGHSAIGQAAGHSAIGHSAIGQSATHAAKEQATKAVEKRACDEQHANGNAKDKDKQKDQSTSSKALQFGCTVNEASRATIRH